MTLPRRNVNEFRPRARPSFGLKYSNRTGLKLSRSNVARGQHMFKHLGPDENVCHQFRDTGVFKYGFNCKCSHGKFSHVSPQTNINKHVSLQPDVSRNVYSNPEPLLAQLEHSGNLRCLVNTVKALVESQRIATNPMVFKSYQPQQFQAGNLQSHVYPVITQ